MVAATIIFIFSVWRLQCHVTAFSIHRFPKSRRIFKLTPCRNRQRNGNMVDISLSTTKTVYRHSFLRSTTVDVEEQYYGKSPLSLTFNELSVTVDGSGRARQIWELLRNGIDPLQQNMISNNEDNTITKNEICTADDSQQIISSSIGQKTVQILREKFGDVTLHNNIAKVVHRSVSSDGTTKLLIELMRRNTVESTDSEQLTSDNFMIETVIIPWPERNSSTVCVSSQVGCRQGCTFCRTGRMGKLTDLTTDEILIQVLYSIRDVQQSNQYPIHNIVFMGMGEPADNAKAVVRAANILTDPFQFQLSPRRVTISTIAPTPESFHELGNAQALIAWSVHASEDTLRQQLVPTTKYSMTKLRDDGLKPTLLKRSKNSRAVMFEVTLLSEINDTPSAASHLASFCQPLLETIPGMKLIVNLIPWNDISAESGPASSYKKPSMERVRTFQKTFLNEIEMFINPTDFTKNRVVCFIRTTRGDEESAACGQLATTKPVRHAR